MLIKSLRSLKGQKQFGNLVTYGFGQAFSLLTPILVVPYLVAICGEEGYGKIGIGMALSFFLIVFIDYGSDIMGTKAVAIHRDNPQKLSEILCTSYVSRSFIFLFVAAAAALAYLHIPYFKEEKALFLLGIPILLGQFLNPTWFLQGVENFKWITFINIVSKVIYAVGIFVSVNSADDYIFANLWWGIGMIAANLAALWYVVLHYRITAKHTSRAKVAAQLRQGFAFLSSQVFVSLQLYAPILLIGYLAGSATAGKYKIVEQVIVIFKTYIFLFFNYAYPRVCYLLERNKQQGMNFWMRYNGANFAFVLSMMALLFVFARDIVEYFNPVAVAEITSLMRFAVLIPIALAVSIPLKQLVLGFGLERLYNKMTIGVVAVMLLSIVILMPVFGLFGVLAALALAELITATIYFAAIRKRLPVIN